MVTEEAQLPNGRLLVGRFGGVEGVVKKDGTRVEQMWRVSVVEDRGSREVRHEAAFFETDFDGEEGRMWRDLQAGGTPKLDERVAVRIATRGTLSGGKAYANDTAIGLTRLGTAADVRG